MARKAPKYLDGLSVDALESAPVNVDGWGEDYGLPLDFDGTGKGFRFWETAECADCGAVIVRECGGGEERHSDLDPDAEHEGEACRGYIPPTEGPMMNYWYPVRLRCSPEDAARKIAHLPLCVVEVEGQTGLALTGGGMDLSWEICAAFVALGFYPPTHFAKLPAMGGRGASASDRRLIRACEESFRIAASWAQNGIEDLKRLRKRAREYAAERKAAQASEVQP